MMPSASPPCAHRARWARPPMTDVRRPLMTRVSRALIVLVLLAVLPPLAAEAWDRGRAERFATLPDGAAHPEGITADDDGNLYVATFEATKPAGSPGEFFVYSPSGRLLRRVTVAGSDSKLLDLAFHPTTGAFLVIDFG